MEWISVKDRMPDLTPKVFKCGSNIEFRDTEILIACDENKEVYVGFFSFCNDGSKEFVGKSQKDLYTDEYMYEVEFEKITHWMPFPKPAKED